MRKYILQHQGWAGGRKKTVLEKFEFGFYSFYAFHQCPGSLSQIGRHIEEHLYFKGTERLILCENLNVGIPVVSLQK